MFRINKKIKLYKFSIIAMVFLLYLMVITSQEIQQANTLVLSLKLSSLGFFFGILIEQKGLNEILKKNVSLNIEIIPSLILIIISFIPIDFWLLWFGMGQFAFRWLINILILRESHIILNVLAGIILVRSLVNTDSL